MDTVARVRFRRAGVVELEMDLGTRLLRVGRAADNDIVLRDPDRSLSRHHAEIRFDGRQWVYVDLSSVNGSWVDGIRITAQPIDRDLTITAGAYQVEFADAGQVRGDTMVDLDLMRPGRPVRAPELARAPGDRATQPDGAARAGSTGGAPRTPNLPRPIPKPPAQAASPRSARRVFVGAFLAAGAAAIVLIAVLRPWSAWDGERRSSTTAAPTTAASTTSVASGTTTTPVTSAPSTVSASTTTVAQGSSASSAPGAAPASAPVQASRPGADPDAAAVPARPGESAAVVRARREDIRRRYAFAIERLHARQYAESLALLAAIADEAPRFRDVTARLAEAEAGLRQQVQDAFDAAVRHEQAEEWSDAVRGYERLRPFAASFPNLEEAIARTRARMHAAGAEALARARYFDGRGRAPEAIGWYQRAVAWLPPDHPDLEAARQRLAELGGGR
jgi:hypothetical protein